MHMYECVYKYIMSNVQRELQSADGRGKERVSIRFRSCSACLERLRFIFGPNLNTISNTTHWCDFPCVMIPLLEVRPSI